VCDVWFGEDSLKSIFSNSMLHLCVKGHRLGDVAHWLASDNISVKTAVQTACYLQL